MNWFRTILFAFVLREVQLANILGLLPMPLLSHTRSFMTIFKELAARGHNVTVYSPFQQKAPIPNLTEIVVPFKMEEVLAKMPNINKMNEKVFALLGLWIFADGMVEKALDNEAIQNLIRDKNSKFDLIMTETFIFQEPLLAFAFKFNAPVINLQPTMLGPSSSHYTGNELPPTYSPCRFLTFNDHMTFLQRAENIFFHFWELILHQLYFIPKQDRLMRKYLQHPDLPKIPPLSEMIRNTSLTLINHNSAVGFPFPTQKNIVEFGGIYAKSNETIPKDLKDILDNAAEGIVYFTFGSYFNISSLPETTQIAFVTALGKLKHKVFMKWENPMKVNGKLPSNVIFRKWFPQASILAHPNCKVFVTHGGIHGLTEGIYHGVPLVAIPVIADQKFNAYFAESLGIGIRLDLKKINEKQLFDAINAVLYEPSYREKMKERSLIFRDKPMDTMDNVIFWIEYVIRHRGARHLRPAILDLYWFQDLMLDVLLFYILILILIIFIIKTILCFVFRLIKKIFCKTKKNNAKSKKE